MPRITPSNLEDVLSRFSGFHDSVLQSFERRFTPKNVFAARIQAKDTSSDSGLSDVTLTANRVSALKIEPDVGDLDVLSDGIKIRWDRSGICQVALVPWALEQETEEEYRLSPFYIGCEVLQYESVPVA